MCNNFKVTKLFNVELMLWCYIYMSENVTWCIICDERYVTIWWKSWVWLDFNHLMGQWIWIRQRLMALWQAVLMLILTLLVKVFLSWILQVTDDVGFVPLPRYAKISKIIFMVFNCFDDKNWTVSYRFMPVSFIWFT